jgi:flagellar basal-body rod modification protein FlgD
MSVSSVNRSTTVSPSAATPSAAAGGSAASNAKTFDALLASIRQTPSDTRVSAAEAEAAANDGKATEERFLKLLVAQMKNQDPLNPLDNAAVTTQLAQINTVQGIEKLNASVQKMLDRDGTADATDAAAMIGRRVLVDGDAIELPVDGVARGGFELSQSATAVRIDVVDRAGTTVDTLTRTNLPAGMQTFEWNGKVGGKTLDPGNYTLRIAAANANQKVEVTPLTAAPVQAVVRGTDGIALQLGAFGSRPLTEVRGIL